VAGIEHNSASRSWARGAPAGRRARGGTFWSQRRIASYGAAIAGALTFLMLTDFGRDTRGPLPLAVHLDELAVAAGLGLDQVTVSGHHFTALGDIYGAIDTDAPRTAWGIELAAIKTRIERLPWIAEATVARAGLNSLSVSVVERRPAAVWRIRSSDASAAQLIDATGRVLGPVSATALTDLPQISGEGAPDALPTLLALLDRMPGLKAHLERADFVAARRWSLTFVSGSVVHLPSEGAANALQQVAGLLSFAGQNQIGRAATAPAEIDLTVAGRVAVRQPAPRPAASSSQMGLQPGNGS
jgi:cell division protein FtsQ